MNCRLVAMLALISQMPAFAAQNRSWTASERIVAVLAINNLGRQTQSLLLSSPQDLNAADHLSRAIASAPKLEAVSAGQALFLRSMFNDRDAKEVADVLTRANIGGIPRRLDRPEVSAQDVVGIDTAQQLIQTIKTARAANPRTFESWRDSASDQLREITRTLDARGRHGDPYIDLLFDGGNKAEFNGDELVELSKKEAPTIVMNSPAGQGIGLVSAASLINVADLAAVLEEGKRRAGPSDNMRNVWENRYLVDRDAFVANRRIPFLSPPDVSTFDPLRELVRVIANRYKISFPTFSESVSVWKAALFHSTRNAFNTPYLHRDPNFRARIVITLLGPAGYFVVGGRVYRTPFMDGLVINPMGLHAGPTYQSMSRFNLIMTAYP